MKHTTKMLAFTGVLLAIGCGAKGEGGNGGFEVGGNPGPPFNVKPPIGAATPGGGPINGGGNGGTGNTGNTGGVGNSGGGGNCEDACGAWAPDCGIPASQACPAYCANGVDVSCFSLDCQAGLECLSGGGSGGGNTGGTAGAGATGGNPNTGGTTSGCTPTDNCASCPDPQSGSEECFTTCTCYVAAGLATENCNAACFGS